MLIAHLSLSLFCNRDKDVVDTISNVKDPLAAAEELRGLAFKNGSTDNITVLVIRAAS